jgi:hypothetical protein
VPSFAVSIACLSLLQGALVFAPARPLRLPAFVRSRVWALVPALSVAFVVCGIDGTVYTAKGLTWLALIGVPPLAAVALAFLVPGARPAAAVLAPALFLLAWLDRRGLAGESAATLLTALSAVTLGTLLVAVAPRPWVKLGIVAMATVDAYTVASDLLQRPNAVLNGTVAVHGLPQLQRVVFGSAVMGYGDVFIAAALGALLVSGARRSGGPALLVAAFALASDLLFFAISELPATVPIALALIVLELSDRRDHLRRPASGAPSYAAALAGSDAPAASKPRPVSQP